MCLFFLYYQVLTFQLTIVLILIILLTTKSSILKFSSISYSSHDAKFQDKYLRLNVPLQGTL